jgi:hypothetical protein
VRAPGARGLLLLRAGVREGQSLLALRDLFFLALESRLLSQGSGAMADTSNECQGVGNFNARS